MQFCNEYAVPKDTVENFKDVTAQDIVCSQVLTQTLLLMFYTYMGFFCYRRGWVFSFWDTG